MWVQRLCTSTMTNLHPIQGQNHSAPSPVLLHHTGTKQGMGCSPLHGMDAHMGICAFTILKRVPWWGPQM